METFSLKQVFTLRRFHTVSDFIDVDLSDVRSARKQAFQMENLPFR